MRRFEDRDVPHELIEKLLEAGNLAPSAGNLQARYFIVVKNKEMREKLSAAAFNQKFVYDAPVDVVVCADLMRIKPYGKRGEELYCIQDASAAVQNILLAAYALGLGTCWVGAFNEREVADVLSLPKHLRPVAIIPIGYGTSSRTTSRLPLGEISEVYE